MAETKVVRIPADVYEVVKEEARRERRTISQQVAVMVTAAVAAKNGSERLGEWTQ